MCIKYKIDSYNMVWNEYIKQDIHTTGKNYDSIDYIRRVDALLYTTREKLKQDLNTIANKLNDVTKTATENNSSLQDEHRVTGDIDSSILSYDSIYKKVKFSVLRERVYFGIASVLLIVFILFFNYKINKKNESLLSVLKQGQFRFNTDIEKVNKKLSDVGEKAKKVGEKAKEAVKKPTA